MSKVNRSLHSDDFYKSYCIRAIAKGVAPKTKKEYSLFLRTMGEVLADEILNNGIVQLPWGHGDVYLKNKKVISFTNDQVKRNVCFNAHTEGMVKGFYWISSERKSKKAKVWCFSAERKMKRALSVNLIQHNKIYPDFEKMLNLS